MRQVPVREQQNRCIVTSTRYLSVGHVRFGLMAQMFEQAAAANIPVFFADSSPEEVSNAIRQAAGVANHRMIVLDGEVSMGLQRRTIIQDALAHGFNALAWIEPEKYGIISQLPRCFDLLEQMGGLVVPGRTKAGFSTYPLFQQASEQQINHTLARMLGTQTIDYTFGPRVFDPEVASLFLAYDKLPDMWEMFYARLPDILRQGLPITGLPIEFAYPQAQYTAENGNLAMQDRRRAQAEQVVAAVESRCIELNHIG